MKNIFVCRMLAASRGIVLRRRKDSEKDLIVRFFTEQGQLLNLKLHGILATTKRSALAGEPGSLVRFDYYFEDAKEIHSVKEAGLESRFEKAKENYKNVYLLSALLELTEKGAVHSEQETAGEIYILLEKALQYINDSPFSDGDSALRLSFYFFYSIRILHALGLAGDPEQCPVCGNKISGRAVWKQPELDFHCSSCDPLADERQDVFRRVILAAMRLRFGRFIEEHTVLGLLESEDWNGFSGALKNCLIHHFSSMNAMNEILRIH